MTPHDRTDVPSSTATGTVTATGLVTAAGITAGSGPTSTVPTSTVPTSTVPPVPVPVPDADRVLRAARDAHDHHRLAEAVQLFHEAGTVAAATGDTTRACEAVLGAALAGVELARWLRGLDRSDDAATTMLDAEHDARHALGAARHVGRGDWAALANALLAVAAVGLDRPDDARRRAQIALDDARSTEQAHAELLATLALGAAAWRHGQAGESLRLLTVAERDAMVAGSPRWLLEVLREQLLAAEAAGSRMEAYSLARRAERIAATLVGF